MNSYPWWKNSLIVLVVLFGLVYAMPNIYAPDPAVQVTGQSSGMELGESELNKVTRALKEAQIDSKQIAIHDNAVLVRLNAREDQLLAKRVIQNSLGRDEYVVALNLAPTTPDWLQAMGASPMKLGLDLSGGVHFLMEVNTEEAIKTRATASMSWAYPSL